MLHRLVLLQGRDVFKIPLTNSVRTKAGGELSVFVMHRADALKEVLAKVVQTQWRMYVQKKRYYSIRFGVIIIQAVWRGATCRTALNLFFEAAQRCQSAARYPECSFASSVD
jgi:hypothetical protein